MHIDPWLLTEWSVGVNHSDAKWSCSNCADLAVATFLERNTVQWIIAPFSPIQNVAVVGQPKCMSSILNHSFPSSPIGPNSVDLPQLPIRPIQPFTSGIDSEPIWKLAHDWNKFRTAITGESGHFNTRLILNPVTPEEISKVRWETRKLTNLKTLTHTYVQYIRMYANIYVCCCTYVHSTCTHMLTYTHTCMYIHAHIRISTYPGTHPPPPTHPPHTHTHTHIPFPRVHCNCSRPINLGWNDCSD